MPINLDKCISHDLPCIQCGYNLRTLSGDGICPECGHPIADSLANFERKQRERPFEPWPGCRNWLRRLAPSPALMLAAMILAGSSAPSFDQAAGTSALAWVLAILAILWITRSPGPHERTGIPAVWRWTLRALAMGLIVPVVLVVVDLVTWNGPQVPEPLCLLFAGISALTTFLFYAYLGIILSQIAQPGWARLSAVAAFSGGVAGLMSYMPAIGKGPDYPPVFYEMPVPGTISHQMFQALYEGVGLLLVAPPISVFCSALVLLHATRTFWRMAHNRPPG